MERAKPTPCRHLDGGDIRQQVVFNHNYVSYIYLLGAMLDVVTPLGTITEFSIGLAGFAGIVAAINRPSGHDERLLTFRFTNLLVTAFAPGFLAILSMSLIYSGYVERKAIYISSVLLLLYLLAWAVYVLAAIPRESASRGMSTFLWVSSIANMALQVMNLVDPSVNLVGFYLFGLLILLLQAALVFAVLALSTLRRTNDA